MKKTFLLCISLFALSGTNTHSYKFGYFNSENKPCKVFVKNDYRTYTIITPQEYDVDSQPSIVAYFVSYNDTEKETPFQSILQNKKLETENYFRFSGDTEYRISEKNRGFSIAASVAFWCSINKKELAKEIINLIKTNTPPEEICKKISSKFRTNQNITIALLIFDKPELFEEIKL